MTDRTLSGMVWVAWGSGAMAVLRILVLVLLTRLLSPADFGVVGAALVVISISLNFSRLGLGPALVQRVELESRHVSTAFFVSTAFGVLVAALVWVLAPLVAEFFRMEPLMPVVRTLALVFPIGAISSVAENLVQRGLRFRLLAKADVLAYCLGYGLVGVVLALLGWGVWALVTAHLTQSSLRAAILLRAAPPVLHPRPSLAAFGELIGFGMGQTAAHGIWFLAHQADKLVVGRWLGAVALGLYGRAYQLMIVPTTLLGDILDRVLFPTIARVQHDSRRVASAYLQGTALIALVTLPTGLVAAILAPDLVRVAFGSRWEAMIPPFQVLALGMMFQASHRLSASLARATGKVYRRAWREALYASLVFLGAWLGHYYGIFGVAAGVLGALVVKYLVMAQLGLNLGGISWLQFVQAQLPAVGLTAVLGSVTFAATAGTRLLGLPPLAGLVAGSAVAVGTAALMAWRVPRFALGEHGVRMGHVLHAYLLARRSPQGLRSSI